jgi:hypothetical protein
VIYKVLISCFIAEIANMLKTHFIWRRANHRQLQNCKDNGTSRKTKRKEAPTLIPSDPEHRQFYNVKSEESVGVSSHESDRCVFLKYVFTIIFETLILSLLFILVLPPRRRLVPTNVPQSQSNGR